MRFHQALSTAANLGAICFALANDKRFFLEEEAEMAKDFGDLMGCVVRKFLGGVRFAVCLGLDAPRS